MANSSTPAVADGPSLMDLSEFRAQRASNPWSRPIHDTPWHQITHLIEPTSSNDVYFVRYALDGQAMSRLTVAVTDRCQLYLETDVDWYERFKQSNKSVSGERARLFEYLKRLFESSAGHSVTTKITKTDETLAVNFSTAIAPNSPLRVTFDVKLKRADEDQVKLHLRRWDDLTLADRLLPNVSTMGDQDLIDHHRNLRDNWTTQQPFGNPEARLSFVRSADVQAYIDYADEQQRVWEVEQAEKRKREAEAKEVSVKRSTPKRTADELKKVVTAPAPAPSPPKKKLKKRMPNL